MADETSKTSTQIAQLQTFLDSGAPEGSTDYTTVVIVHGWSWHGGSFKKLLPFAKQYNARVVLVNRRDYPKAEPYTSEQLATLARLAAAPASPEAAAEADAFMRDRARELYDYLADFVRREHIPPAQDGKGGIVVSGWSFGTIWMTALLANVGLFPEGDVQLSKYVRRVVLYDASYMFYGYANPPKWYKPLYDDSIPPEERLQAFTVWITGYFQHGDVFAQGPDALEYRTYLADPAPSGERFTPADVAETTRPLPESEQLIAGAFLAQDEFSRLREAGLYLARAPVEGASDWRDVEVKHLWCDRSVWDMPWGAKLLSEELEAAKTAGKPLRKNALVRFKGANHFAHWDVPEKMLKALLSDDPEIN